VFRLVRYDAPAGKLAAYLTPDPGDGRKHPAIVWITGGDCNSIGEVWKDAPRENDQTAAAYRKAGIVMMFPSLRGGNDNPGRREGFFGEVDDILAAAEHLARQDYVDPDRIYLGGHSTGGTLVMLVAELSDRFRAAFSFGPVDDVRGYPPDFCPFDRSNPRESELRSPGRWLDSVRRPLFVFEGTDDDSNIPSLQSMARASINPLVHFLPAAGFDHFSVLAPTNEIIAAKILRDDGPTTNLAFSKDEVSRTRD
jgi:dipeptidyl aminopeptidase/acylaminoacyl peptidase